MQKKREQYPNATHSTLALFPARGTTLDAQDVAIVVSGALAEWPQVWFGDSACPVAAVDYVASFCGVGGEPCAPDRATCAMLRAAMRTPV